MLIQSSGADKVFSLQGADADSVFRFSFVSGPAASGADLISVYHQRAASEDDDYTALECLILYRFSRDHTDTLSLDASSSHFGKTGLQSPDLMALDPNSNGNHRRQI
ncbi:hypothetical protein LXL04_019611 [Taraxacum kok-saghyz]